MSALRCGSAGIADARYEAAREYVIGRVREQELRRKLGIYGLCSAGGQVVHTHEDCPHLDLKAEIAGDSSGVNINRFAAPPGLRHCTRCAALKEAAA